ncbi:helix-turn-helix domain-containing protein [Streptomyces sp. NPDC096319]|uniref:helix-turn-helix domain-containing protein n=1 Tax=Streptomyces sp. NPDC096319 TaxID=3366084 RepID=UPI0037FE57FB
MAVGAHGTDKVGGTGGRGKAEGAPCSGCAGCRPTTPWAELAAEMRRIKGATELSYGTLAQRTHYSRSSWERFLNQKQLPTRVAVEEFAAAAGADPAPLLLRLERSLAHETATRAAAAAHDRARDGAPPAAPAAPAPRRESRLPGLGRPLGLLAAGALVGGGVVTALNRAARIRRGA